MSNLWATREQRRPHLPKDELDRYVDEFGKTSADLEAQLKDGPIEVVGQIENSSNYTFLVTVGDKRRAIYKPTDGERPLHDFPAGLHKREVGAYEFSKLVGWHLVPPTVERDGPFGIGSVQAFVDADFTEHYLTLLPHDKYRGALQQLCALDYIMNNTDRKSGHCLLGKHIWAIDNGLCFHSQFKLRTVIWDFAGQPVPASHLESLKGIELAKVRTALEPYLDSLEVSATLDRLALLLDAEEFPQDETGGHRYPWPPI